MAESASFGAGDLQGVRLTDGELPYPPALLLANAQPDELARALAGELDAHAVESRRGLLERAADEELLVAGYRLGRNGYVERDGDTFRLVREST